MSIEIDKLSKIFPPHFVALKEITVSIASGKVVGVIGPDGAGKTTLIRLIAGLLCPSSGTIAVLGHDSLKEAEAIHFFTGYMPQKFGLYEELTVMQNLSLYADLRDLRGEERQERVKSLLQFTGLASCQDRQARALSGGMKQKLGLACALVKKPTLLLLDEPSVGVDPISRRELWKMIYALSEEGTSIILSTSYLDEAERCHSTLLLNEGSVIFYGDPNQLVKRVEGHVFKITDISGSHRTLLREVLRDTNTIDGVIQGKNIRIVVKDKNVLEGRGFTLEPAPPRFEDAFVDILGGVPNAESKLADLTPPLQKSSGVALEASELTKKFGAFTAVDRVSFTVQRGEVFGLLGPNGAGKTTTFKMLCGLLTPTEGKVSIGDLDLHAFSGEARAHIGYMGQKCTLYGMLTVRQNLEFFSGIYNLRGQAQREIVEKMLSIFDLEKYADISADSLPLGYRQRLGMASANMHHPELIFLDEPTSGVDPLTRRDFWSHINGLVTKGRTVLITTHFMDEAEYCDRIALIYAGRVIHIGTPDALKELARSEQQPTPTLEEAFITLIERHQ
jgi:ABC-2 type transport system ATP-binding protein